MLKNKIIVRKIRNIVILLMAIIIMFGAYKNIDRSRAENVIEIGAIALDNYGYLADEHFVLEAKQTEDDLYEIELPDTINGKKINRIVKISLIDFQEVTEEENLTIEPVVEETPTEEPTPVPVVEEAPTEEPTPEPVVEEAPTEEPTSEPVVEETPTEEPTPAPVVEETTKQEPATEPEKAMATEEIDVEKTIITEETLVEDEIVIEGNKIYLTEEQIDNQEINIEVEYDIAIAKQNEQGVYEKVLLTEKSQEERKQLELEGQIKIEQLTPTTGTIQQNQILYSKILRYEDKENNKIIELKGYLPIDAELKVEQVTTEKLEEIFEEKHSKIDVAYDIKMLVKVVTQVPADEADPTAQPEEIVETIEINPEEFGEKCEVSIKDAKIATESQVYHVKEDNTYEEVQVTENTEGDISFEAETFSIYAISDDELIPDEGIALGAPGVSFDGGQTWYSGGDNPSYGVTVWVVPAGSIVATFRGGEGWYWLNHSNNSIDGDTLTLTARNIWGWFR